MNKLKITIEKTDVFLFLIVPVICVIIFLLPANIQELLKLNIPHPQIWQIMTSSYTHANLTHLTNNLSSYILMYLFIFFMVPNKTKKLRNLFISLFFAVPIIISVFQIVVYPRVIPKLLIACGLSGIVSAMGGILIILVLFKLGAKKYFNYTKIFTIIILISATGIGLIYTQDLLLIILSAIILLILISTSIKELKYMFYKFISSEKISKVFIISALILYFTLTFSIFPTELVSNMGVIDISIHYLGLFLGIGISYLSLK